MVAKGLKKGCERVMCERWVGDWTNCNILTPTSFAFSSTSFSFCWFCSIGGSWGSIAICWVLVLSTASYLQLTEPVCGTGLYNCLTSTCFLWASHLHRIQPVVRSRLYLDVFDRMHLFLDWRLGRRSICYKMTIEHNYGGIVILES